MTITRRMVLRCCTLVAASGALAACVGVSAPGPPTPALIPTAPAEVTAEAQPVSPAIQARLLVLHTNDVMGYVDPCG